MKPLKEINLVVDKIEYEIFNSYNKKIKSIDFNDDLTFFYILSFNDYNF